jgi:transposase
MKRMDARRLSPDAQEDLRRRVVYAVRVDGMSPSSSARTFGVCRQSVAAWIERVELDGSRALAARKRGPKPGRSKLGDAALERQIVRSIRRGCPDQLLLPFALWSREAVVALIHKRTGRTVSLSTAGRYLRHWNMTPQKPMRRAYERDPAAVKAWLKSEYPAIKARAKEENALILWGDEMGLRSDDQIGRSYAPRGKTPVVDATGKRFGCNMISAISNLGQLWFMVFAGRLNAGKFIEFLGRLLRVSAERKLFLIIDSHPAHKAAKVRRWLDEKPTDRAGRLERFFLPGYSPHLNPDECLNQDTKQAMKKNRPHDQREMIGQVRSHLQRRQKQPAIVQRFFHEEHVRYAAAQAIVDVK